MIGFGCTLGSTVSISFVVDSYRADAGSSLTSLNLAKNVIGTYLSYILSSHTSSDNADFRVYIQFGDE